MDREPPQQRIGDRRAALVASIAASQHGVVTREQLRATGLGAGAVDGWIRRSRLHPLHRGVYLLGHRAATQRALELATILACGDGAVLSHRSAAHLWRLLPYPPDPAPHDVTVPGRKLARRPALRIHRGSSLRRHEWLVRDGVRVTSPARTLLDLAAQAPTHELGQAVNEAHALRLIAPQNLRRVLADHSGRPGVRALANAAGLDHLPGFTRSEAERRFLSLLHRAALPLPETNVRVGRHEVDFLWRAERLAIETDGWASHSSRTAFERDRKRDAELAARGLTVIRVTWRQLTRAPETMLVSVAQALAVRAATPRRTVDGG